MLLCLCCCGQPEGELPPLEPLTLTGVGDVEFDYLRGMLHSLSMGQDGPTSWTRGLRIDKLRICLGGLVQLPILSKHLLWYDGGWLPTFPYGFDALFQADSLWELGGVLAKVAAQL